MMKRIFTLTLLVVFTFCTAQAQKNIVKVNPLSLAYLALNLQYERALNPKMSLQLGTYFGRVEVNTGDSKDNSFIWGITPEYRFYLTHKSKYAPRGLFVAPFARYEQQGVSSFSDEIDGFGNPFQVREVTKEHTYRGGVTLGYQWLFADAISMEVFAGPSYDNVSITQKSDLSRPSQNTDVLFPDGEGSSFGVRAGLAVGVTF